MILRMIVYDHLDAAAARTKERIQWLLDLEQLPTTFNTHYYADYRSKFFAHYKNCRDKNNLKSRNQTTTDRQVWTDGVKKALSALAEIGINSRVEDLPKLLPADPMEAAITIMASVRAYFQGAYWTFDCSLV